MAAAKKKGVATAAPTKQAEQGAAASAAVPAPSPETDAHAAADAVAEQAAAQTPAADADTPVTPAEGEQANAELDAVNTAQVVAELEQVDPQAAAEVLASGGVDTTATLASADADAEAEAEAVELTYPLRVRVVNNTRMPVQLAVVPLWLGAAPDVQTVLVNTEGEHKAMLADLESLRTINEFGPDAFVVEPLIEDAE